MEIWFKKKENNSQWQCLRGVKKVNCVPHETESMWGDVPTTLHCTVKISEQDRLKLRRVIFAKFRVPRKIKKKIKRRHPNERKMTRERIWVLAQEYKYRQYKINDDD